MQLLLNSVWGVHDFSGLEAGNYRVLYFDSIIDICVVFRLDENESFKRRPVVVSLSSFSKSISCTDIVSAEFKTPIYMQISEEDIEENSKLKRDEDYSLISGLIDNIDFLISFALARRKYSIEKHAAEKGTTRFKVMRLLRRYWRYGQQVNALISAYSNCGSYGQPKVAGKTPLGAPRVQITLASKRALVYKLGEVDKKWMGLSIKKHYLKSPGKSALG